MLKNEAIAAAQAVNIYWLEKGYHANAKAVESSLRGGGKIWVVRSDLINGLPKGFKG